MPCLSQHTRSTAAAHSCYAVLLTDRAARRVVVTADTSFPYHVLFVLPFVGFWVWSTFAVALCEFYHSHWFHIWWSLSPAWLMFCSYVILKHIPKFVSYGVFSAYLWFPFVLLWLLTSDFIFCIMQKKTNAHSMQFSTFFINIRKQSGYDVYKFFSLICKYRTCSPKRIFLSFVSVKH
jgi:hypothetical protein